MEPIDAKGVKLTVLKDVADIYCLKVSVTLESCVLVHYLPLSEEESFEAFDAD